MELGQCSPPSLPEWLTQLHPGGVVLQESLSSKGTLSPPQGSAHQAQCRLHVTSSGKALGSQTDIKYATIGIAVGFATSASFLALKICMIRKHLFDNDSSEQRSTNVGFNDSIELKKRTPSGQVSSEWGAHRKKHAERLPTVTKSMTHSSPVQVIANSSNTESDTFPSICLLTLGNDFFPFCHQSG
ncbi:transmembrane protein 273 [Pseudorca crassidens]|uniref:transmembrane protein 273 n=1 Tax=Pseudorca crassidens TaxID=82174 RepID=UPI00352C4FF1